MSADRLGQVLINLQGVTSLTIIVLQHFDMLIRFFGLFQLLAMDLGVEAALSSFLLLLKSIDLDFDLTLVSTHFEIGFLSLNEAFLGFVFCEAEKSPGRLKMEAF